MTRIDNLTDPKAPIHEIKTRLLVVETQAPLGYSSVTDGQIRIASPQGLWVQGEGGIRLDGRMDADGVIDVTGTLTVKGRDGGSGGVFTAEGTNTLSGKNLLSGPTDITGALKIKGATEITGSLTTSEGGVTLGGPVNITDTLEVSATTKLAGNTDIGGTLTISGATVVDNTFRTNGAVTVAGSITVTGSASFQSTLTISGAASLSNTLTVSGAIVSGGVRIENNRVQVSAGGITTTLSGAGLEATVGTFQSLGTRQLTMDAIDEVTSISGVRWLGVLSGGKVIAVPQSVGGPMGDLEWPFDPATNTDEYGPRESPGGIGSTFHRGMDFGIGVLEGTPIPAAGSGTVIETGTGVVGGTGFGNFVVIQHANGKRTLYGHMNAAPTWSVGDGIAKGATVGYVGNTGSSTGAHLHFETHILDEGGYTAVNPRDVITKPWGS